MGATAALEAEGITSKDGRAKDNQPKKAESDSIVRHTDVNLEAFLPYAIVGLWPYQGEKNTSDFFLAAIPIRNGQ